ncbi:MAG TPA: glutathione S-transferase N-terminal domain-containing protein [Burkholderiales bacterium]|nr:glutathione S-transferase N-terminal domain-containing protein [Burkholderiales bacterium]
MIDLYLAPTANGLRASVALEEAGLAYRAHKIDLAKGEQRSAEFLKLNPAGLIPVILDDSAAGGKPLALSQSGAIMLYAAEKSGKLLPRDPARRALALQWLMQAGSDVSGASNAVFQMEMRAPEKSATNLEYLKKRLIDFFSVCDRRLEGRDFLADELSVADLMLYPNFALRKPMLDAAGGLPNLQRWGAALAARPGVARGMQVLG